MTGVQTCALPILMYAQVALLFVAYLFATARLNDIKSLSDYCVLFGLAFSIFSARQWENLYWAMQLAFPLYLALSFSAFFYAQRYWSSRRTSDLCVALALALCAATSNGAGIFTLILTCIAVSLARPNARDLTLSIAFAVSGTIFFILSQSASTNGGIGASVPDLQQFVRHAAQMLALTWLDFGEHKTVAEIFAVVFALVLVGTVVRTFKYRSLYTFELLSISIGLLVLLGVSYARVSAGIFQPDASRYIPLVIPIAVGSILIFRKSNWNFLLILALLMSMSSYGLSYYREVRLAAARHHNLEEARIALCTNGKIHPAHNFSGAIQPYTMENLQKLFCHTVSQIEHTNIDDSNSEGFSQEDSQTWISPLFQAPIPQPTPNTVVIRGWLPDISGYPDERFSLSLFANGKEIATTQLLTGGSFEIRAELPQGSSVLRIESTEKLKVSRDARALSWILGKVSFYPQ